MRDGMPVLAMALVLAAVVAPATAGEPRETADAGIAAGEPPIVDAAGARVETVDASAPAAAAQIEGTERLVFDLDADGDGEDRPEHSSPVEPGEPCDDYG